MSDKPLISFDYAIKYLLRNKSDYDIVEGFISALLKAEGYGPVKITGLLDAESNKEKPSLRKSIADLIVEDESGKKYIVEVEREFTSNFVHKACFNSSRLIVDSITTGVDYSTIKKVFHISLLYFKIDSIKNTLIHGKTIFKTADTKEPIELHLADLGGQIFDLNILPEYFLISVPFFDNVIRQEIDEWLYVMKNSDVKEDFKSPYMKKVKERLNILTMTPEEKDSYYTYMKEVLTQRDVISAAEVKAKAEGIAEGKAEGKAEGMAEGIAKGKAEEKSALAKKMLNQNIDVKLIADITNLTIEQINSLK
jgi:predicted transposase/invertase (TIGR01784 family)